MTSMSNAAKSNSLGSRSRRKRIAASTPAEAFAGTLTDLYMPKKNHGPTPIGLPDTPW
jgi:hypothetical protein